MKEYKRLTKRLMGSNAPFTEYASDNEVVQRLAELEDKIENGTLQEVIRCKDCVYFQPEYVEMENGERRPYTEQEIKNGKLVSLVKGINCGSRCERFRYWEKNPYPVWFNENDFCSYGKLKEKGNDSFDCGYHEYAKEKHDERVADTPNRIDFAKKQFESNNIDYDLKNEATGHFHCWRKSDDKLFQFYAGTGKIVGVSNKRGIHEFIKILSN